MINCNGGDNQLWQKSLRRYLPDHQIWTWQDIPDESLVRYAVVSGHPHGDLLRFQNLSAVLSLSAGIEHLISDPDFEKLTERTMIVRMNDCGLSRDMAHYALYWALHFQRNFQTYRQLQNKAQWRIIEAKPCEEFTIAIIGIGHIGVEIAKRLFENGFAVTGFTRRCEKADELQKRLPEQVKIFCGENWKFFLQKGQIFVNLLPAVATTDNLLNKDVFSQMPKGAVLINIGRGNSVNGEDLMAALDCGQMGFAVLDVFAQEPLSVDSPLWHHPKISITPHIAGLFHPESMMRSVSENIIRMENGEPPFPIFDKRLGY